MKKTLVVLGVLFLLTGCGKSKTNIESNSFFLKTDNGYQLYSMNGSIITDTKFDKHNEYNDYYIVKKDDKVGVINKKGKITVSFEKYERIETFLNFFVGYNGDNKYIIDGNDNTIIDLKDNEIYKSDSKSIFIVKNTKDKKIVLINKNGKPILNIPYNTEDIYIKETEDYAVVFNNGINYLLDINNTKEITNFKSDRYYCVDKVDKNQILLKTCKNNLFETNVEYRLVLDNKVYNDDNSCSKMTLHNNTATCTNSTGTFIYINGKNSLQLTKDIAYINGVNYAKNSEKNGVDFYNSGSTKHVDCRKLVSSGSIDGLYVLTTSKGEGCNLELNYELYDEKGNKVNDIETKDLSSLDINNNYLVKYDGKYYLLNKNGKKISTSYDKIEQYKGFYIAENDYLRGVLDITGNVLLEVKYDILNVIDVGDTKYVYGSIIDNQDIIYDVNNKKQLFFSHNKIKPTNNYFYVDNFGSRYYYSYINGKMFYKEEVK